MVKNVESFEFTIAGLKIVIKQASLTNGTLRVAEAGTRNAHDNDVIVCCGHARTIQEAVIVWTTEVATLDELPLPSKARST